MSTPSRPEESHALRVLSHDPTISAHGADFSPNSETALPSTSTQSASIANPAPNTRHFVEIHAYLTIFALAGALARLWLTALTTYDGAPFAAGGGAVLWANVAGCVIMGALVASPHRAQPWWIGLTTGLCGSLTSFSSFGLAVFRLVDGAGAGERFMHTVAYLLATVALSLAALVVGGHAASAVGARRLWMPLPPAAVIVLL